MLSVLAVLYAATGAVYLLWRPLVFNPDAPLFSLVFYIAEIAAFLAGLVRLAVMRHASGEALAQCPSPPLDWPTIDVFVTTLNEPVDMVRRTLFAARGMEGRGTVWLLDDGCRDEMRDLAAAMDACYLPRSERVGAKAGNLNHGLTRSSAEFIAVFDADHAPEARFLSRLMGYFAEPDVAMVQTPQDYFNAGSFQHVGSARSRNIWHEQSLFHWAEQPARDAINATTCCGCSMIVRRAALDAVGGFPTETVTEDMHLSVRFHKRGLRVRYHAEPLAFGIAPAGPQEFIRQRLRWGEGNMQVTRVENIPFSKDLTRLQNLSYFMLGTTYLEAWTKLVIYVSPIVFLWTAVPPIWSGLPVFLWFFLPYFVVGLLTFVEYGHGFAPLFSMEKFAMARFTAGLAATGGLFRTRIAFRVASKALGSELFPLVLLPQMAIAVLGPAGLVYAWFSLHEDQWGAPLDISAAIAVLAIYNAFLAIWVVSHGFVAGRAKLGGWSSTAEFPIAVADDDGYLSNVAISDRYAVDLRSVPSKDCEEARLLLPHGELTVHLHPAYRYRGQWVRRIEWFSQEDRDVAVHAFTVGSWQRVISGRSERCPTWLEYLGIVRKRPRLARSGSWGGWRMIDGATRLAYIGEDKTVVIFGADSVPESNFVLFPLGQPARCVHASAEPMATNLWVPARAARFCFVE